MLFFFSENDIFDPPQENKRDQCQGSGKVTGRIESASRGKADAGNDPEAGGGRQTLDPLPFADDRACSEKADSGNHTRCDAGWIKRNLTTIYIKNVKRSQHDKTGSKANQYMRAQSRAASMHLTLKADEAA